jgi:hypothetical protein
MSFLVEDLKFSDSTSSPGAKEAGQRMPVHKLKKFSDLADDSFRYSQMTSGLIGTGKPATPLGVETKFHGFYRPTLPTA